MAQTIKPSSVFPVSDSYYTSDESFQNQIDDSPCYALLEFPDTFYRVQSLKLVLGREPDDIRSYDHRLVVTDQLTANPRKRKRTHSSDDEASLAPSSPMMETMLYRQTDYENCITAVGGIGGPQPEPLLLDDPDEVFVAIHPSLAEDGEVRDKAISKQHMRLFFSEELGWVLEVIGRNGVFINDNLHMKGDQIQLEDKDEFTVAGLHFRWHTTPVDADSSDSEVMDSEDEDDVPLRLTLREDPPEQPLQASYAMDIDDIESEEDDGYNEDEESEEEMPVPKPRVVEKKKEKKGKKKKQPKLKLVKKVEEMEVEEPEPKPSLKLKLKIGKAKLEKHKAGKAPASKTVASKKKPKVEQGEQVDKTEEVPPLAGKKPKSDEEKEKTTPVIDQPAAETTPAEKVTVDVMQSVEMPDVETSTPRPNSTGEPRKPSMSPLTPQVGHRDPVLAGLEPPPKRRGPGRPPADGVMSKRERRERQKAEAAGIPYGDPLPFKAKSKEDDIEGGEKPKKKVKREISGVGEDGEDVGDENADSAPPVPREPSPKESDYPPERLQKPDETYQVLLYQVLSEAKDPLALPGVYDAIKNKWPYFRFKVGGTGWESSVRHNLQSSKYFKKAGKAGKGHLWAIDPDEPFEHKAKRATPPPSAAAYQAPRPYPYANGMQMPARPAGVQQYPGYYAGQVPMANGQRPGMPPGQQQYPGNYYTHNTIGQPGAPGVNGPMQNRPGAPYPPQANGPRPMGPGQQNGFRPPGTASPAPGSTRPNPAFEQVCAGQIPDVFNKFQDQLRKITSQPGAQGNNVAVDQAALAIKWIMAHPRSDEGIEKETVQLQHMTKVLRTLLEPIPNNPAPLRPGMPGGPMKPAAMAGHPAGAQPRPMPQQAGGRPLPPAPGFGAPGGPAPQSGPGMPGHVGQPMQPNPAFVQGQGGQAPRPPAQPGQGQTAPTGQNHVTQPNAVMGPAPQQGMPGSANAAGSAPLNSVQHNGPAPVPITAPQPGGSAQVAPMQAVPGSAAPTQPAPAQAGPGQIAAAQPPQSQAVPVQTSTVQGAPVQAALLQPPPPQNNTLPTGPLPAAPTPTPQTQPCPPQTTITQLTPSQTNSTQPVSTAPSTAQPPAPPIVTPAAAELPKPTAPPPTLSQQPVPAVAAQTQPAPPMPATPVVPLIPTK
jgi:hypothetical protein